MNPLKIPHRPLFLLILLAAALLVAGCGGGSAANDEVVATGLPNLAEATTRGVNNAQRGLEPGQLAPDFTLQFPDGTKTQLSDWQGQPVVLNFWATWCAPCREEMPEFVAAYDRYQDDGLVVVGVNAQETASQAAAFMGDFNMGFPVALDTRGDVQQLYNVRGLPTTVFIDREGRIVERWAGLLRAPALEELLAEIR
ncbi:MAG TPA: TlpA disulfide reductase family protein [Anaerolineae bacterium]|nr:TlpA disulfide reductase family protein [Anaerolineae bacterium]